MGDAAHPMYPIGSNGASQAILDARVLTREILAHGPTNAALVAYEAERRPATTDLVMLNRRNGPEQVMQLVEERAPDGFNVVTDVLSLKELEDIAANYKRVAGFQVEGLNAKPPIVQSAAGPCGLATASGSLLPYRPAARWPWRSRAALPSSAVSLPSTNAMVLPSWVTLASPVIGPGFAGARKFTVMVMVAV